jgi:hypothetical protein
VVKPEQTDQETNGYLIDTSIKAVKIIRHHLVSVEQLMIGCINQSDGGAHLRGQ